MTSDLDEERMNLVHDIFFCYDLGIYLTANDCCHEDSCPYAAQCLLINRSCVDALACAIQEAADMTSVREQYE